MSPPETSYKTVPRFLHEMIMAHIVRGRWVEVFTLRVLPYWLVLLRTMPLFLRRSPMMAERLAATLAAASFLAAACLSFSGVVADKDRPKIFLHSAGPGIQTNFAYYACRAMLAMRQNDELEARLDVVVPCPYPLELPPYCLWGCCHLTGGVVYLDLGSTVVPCHAGRGSRVRQQRR